MAKQIRYVTGLALGIVLGGFSAAAAAAVTPEELARLGADLTPLGAERAGNGDGTIPAWEGGITKPVAGYTPGDHHPDPYAGDPVLYTVTRENMDRYADRLTEGHKALLKSYDSFSMRVFPTRRSASVPQRIYDATLRDAPNARLEEGDNGVAGAVQGIPFPLPKSGVEVVWNHMLRYRGDSVVRNFSIAPVTRGGEFSLVQFREDAYFRYHLPEMTEQALDNILFMFTQKILSPPRLAGQVLLVHETLNQNVENRKAWVYNPGQRRVRRAPNVAFDNPKNGADGLTTSDTLDMYNGSPERYDWKLVGKREMLVPYNSYALHSDQLKYSDILTPLHLNPAHLRYELHRVWVVEGTLKEGTRHIYKRRTFYVDEDTWQIMSVDQYDNRDELWRVSEGHGINYYEVPTYWTTVEVHYDLQLGRYVAIGVNNEDAMYDFSVTYSPADFSTGELRREGRR
ncbi:MAG TPA: DUF1329 domain-containing protein [Gammaproteobacteria bacterium]